jgi:hypothetical protein
VIRWGQGEAGIGRRGQRHAEHFVHAHISAPVPLVIIILHPAFQRNLTLSQKAPGLFMIIEIALDMLASAPLPREEIVASLCPLRLL